MPRNAQPTKTEPTAATPVVAMIRKAESGDTSVLPELREWLRTPAHVDAVGNLAARVEEAYLDQLCGTNLATREGVKAKLAALRASLTDSDAPALECLLASRAVACWLHLQCAELQYARTQDRSLTYLTFAQRRIDGIHRRYLASLKALALVRKLAPPVLQVNIADQQVNVATRSAGELGRDPLNELT